MERARREWNRNSSLTLLVRYEWEPLEGREGERERLRDIERVDHVYSR